MTSYSCCNECDNRGWMAAGEPPPTLDEFELWERVAAISAFAVEPVREFVVNPETDDRRPL